LNIPDQGASAKTSLIKSGNGTWDVTNPHNSDTPPYTSGNYGGYTGGTTISGGTLGFAGGALGASGTIEFTGSSTLRWDSGNAQDLSSRLKIGDGITATIDTGANSVAFAAALTLGPSSSGALTKQGNGSLTLSGANTYSGSTVVNGGMLLVNGSLGSSSAVSVNGGTLGGSGTVAGTVAVNSGGTLAPGTSIGMLGLGSLTLNSGSTTAMEIGDGPTGDKAAAAGAVIYGGTLKLIWTGSALTTGTVDLFDGSGFSGAFTSLQVSNWPAAYRVNTGNLLVNGSIAITANVAPVAQNITAGVVRGESVTLPILGGKHTATDTDGDSLSVTAVGPPTSGAVGFSTSNVTYIATGNLGTNTFTYTVTDAFGSSDTKTVTVIVADPQGFNQVSAGVSGGSAVLSYLGMPGTNYALEITHTLPATNWTPIVTNPASGSGYLFFTNPISLAPTNDYYRTRYAP
jgi:autotransporter-associated beta strand protein